MSLLNHAKRELDSIGMTEQAEDIDFDMRNHLLHMVEEFAKAGHSGFSAEYAANMLGKLFRFQPLGPLTGEDSEWFDVSEASGEPMWQNNRCSHVFKDATRAYDLDGIIWYDEITQEDGSVDRSYFTNLESRTTVTFPYTPKSEYRQNQNAC